jgi:HD-GYP domain-containing protein (c-di-GMP phosphodiesterase class II)
LFTGVKPVGLVPLAVAAGIIVGSLEECDHQYTGLYSRDVVDLTLKVIDHLGLSTRERRDAEFVALLHDVGKVRVPKSIINKPGPLTAEERAVMEQHTVEGERLLLRVGGLLGERSGASSAPATSGTTARATRTGSQARRSR